MVTAKFESPVTGAEQMESQVLRSGTSFDFSGVAGQVGAAGQNHCGLPTFGTHGCSEKG